MTSPDRRGSESGSGKPKGVQGRRTMGPPPRPGRVYSTAVGLLFLALVVVMTLNAISSGGKGILGLDEVSTDEPLAEFAVPVAVSALEGDANVAQDDCESDQLPCPSDQRRTPACEVRLPNVIRVCDYFDRPLVISFWFSQGGDCENQQDVVSEVSRRYRGRVGFLSIDVRDSRDSVRDLVRERGWRMPVGYDHDGAVSTLYRVGGCPTFVYAYPGGILESASIGELDSTELSAKVDALLAATRRKQDTDR
jgi:thiol-disulfide isomerase/thioredoxin